MTIVSDDSDSASSALSHIASVSGAPAIINASLKCLNGFSIRDFFANSFARGKIRSNKWEKTIYCFFSRRVNFHLFFFSLSLSLLFVCVFDFFCGGRTKAVLFGIITARMGLSRRTHTHMHLFYYSRRCWRIVDKNKTKQNMNLIWMENISREAIRNCYQCLWWEKKNCNNRPAQKHFWFT